MPQSAVSRTEDGVAGQTNQADGPVRLSSSCIPLPNGEVLAGWSVFPGRR
jgi:hypothetical protein